MKLTAESTVLDDKKIGDSFATLQVEADGIRTEVGTKVGNNEVISRINQTAETIKIQADKVNIEGATIFTSGRLSQSSLDGAYDASGSATSAVNGLKTDLSSASGTTVINGGHIETGTLSSEKITVESQTLTTALNGKAASGAENTANHYITDIGSDGIRVHDSHTSNNSVVINSNGMEVFKGGTAAANSVAKYSDTVRIGKPSGASRIELDYHSLQLIDKEGNTYFYASDLRNTEGVATITGEWTGDGTTKIFQLSPNATEATYTVKVNGTATTSGLTKYTNRIVFTTAPTKGTTIEATYSTTSSAAKAYTFGLRKSDSNIGGYSVAEGAETTASGYASHAEGWSSVAGVAYSHAEGVSTTASGDSSHTEGVLTVASGQASHAECMQTKANGLYCHAEGSGTTASGDASHAEGDGVKANGYASHAEGLQTVADGRASHAGGRGTKANGEAQTAIGKYNVADTTSLFIIGNGTADNARANAFIVSSTGQVYVNGSQVHSSDRRLKEHISYVGDEAVDFIDSLKPAHYIKDGEKHVGFYAQDVAEVDKWDCMTGELNGYMTLGYMELLAPLVAYVQRLEKRIEELERSK